MASLRAGSARDLVYRAMAALKPEASTGEVVRAIGGKVERNNIDVAIAKGVREGDIKRTGERGGYRYTLRAGVVECAASRAAAVPPPGAKSAAPAAVGGDLSPGLGTRCAVLPENRSQGTIQEALRAVLAVDTPQTTDEVFSALPAGWARADALRALREGAWEGWINFLGGAWTLVGDPPETRAEDPLLVVDIPSHARMRLEEIRGGLNELLLDAIRLHNGPRLIRAIANAYAEVDTALDEINA